MISKERYFSMADDSLGSASAKGDGEETEKNPNLNRNEKQLSDREGKLIINYESEGKNGVHSEGRVIDVIPNLPGKRGLQLILLEISVNDIEDPYVLGNITHQADQNINGGLLNYLNSEDTPDQAILVLIKRVGVRNSFGGFKTIIDILSHPKNLAESIILEDCASLVHFMAGNLGRFFNSETKTVSRSLDKFAIKRFRDTVAKIVMAKDQGKKFEEIKELSPEAIEFVNAQLKTVLLEQVADLLS